MLLNELPETLRPHTRVIGACYGVAYRRGQVTGVGVLQGREVAYVAWDPNPQRNLPSSRDTVVASALIVTVR